MAQAACSTVPCGLAIRDLSFIMASAPLRRTAGKSPFWQLANLGVLLGVCSWLLWAWLEIGLMKSLKAVSSSRGLCPWWQQVEGWSQFLH